MQTYTHVTIGAVIGKVLFPDSIEIQIAIVIGTIIPDLPLIVMFFIDKYLNKLPLENQSKLFIEINNAFHSYFCWITSLFCIPLLIGIYSHLLLDHVSHSKEEYKESDPGMLWPLRYKLRGAFDYRGGHGKIFDRINVVT